LQDVVLNIFSTPKFLPFAKGLFCGSYILAATCSTRRWFIRRGVDGENQLFDEDGISDL